MTTVTIPNSGKLANTTYINSNQDIVDNCSRVGVDTSSSTVTFIVFDAYKEFNNNSCFIVIGVDTFELDKKEKEYEFSYDGSQWNWFEISKKVKT